MSEQEIIQNPHTHHCPPILFGYDEAEGILLKDRIIVNQIPSAREYLAILLEAMQENRVVSITYCAFNKAKSYTFPIEPYCVKLFENRWYVLAHNITYNDIRIYGLDRIEKLTITDERFYLPKDFSAAEYFSSYFGIVTGYDLKPERIVIRAYRDHIRIVKGSRGSSYLQQMYQASIS